MDHEQTLAGLLGHAPTGRMAPLSSADLAEQAHRLLTWAEGAAARGARAEALLRLEGAAALVARLGDVAAQAAACLALEAHDLDRAREILVSALHVLSIADRAAEG